MVQDTVELYQQYCLKLIVPALEELTGRPKNVLSDDKLYRCEVVEPTWQLLPLPLRALGRDALHWNRFFAELRQELFLTADDKIQLRPDAAARADAIAERLFGKPSKPGFAAAARPPLARPLPGPPTPPMAKPVPSSPAPAAQKAPSAPPPRALGDGHRDLVIGIDLGTTYSVVAHLDAHGRPTCIPNGVGEILTPSVVLFDEGGPVVGKEAVMAAAMEPEKIAECVKRDMGSKFYRKKVNEEHLPPEVISSMILRSLRQDAERKLGPVKKAVITVPAYFDEARRRATVDAGKLAGLEVLDTINEPTAAAIAYGYQVGFLDPTARHAGVEPFRVLIYDLGGGTFDVTILEIKGPSFRALATDGDVSLGGKDWDETLVNYAADQFIALHREDPRNNPSSAQELWQAAETAKKALTERTKATIFIHHIGTRMKIEIMREQFEEFTAALLDRTQMTCELVVRQAGLRWSQIDRVLLVGGSTRMPMVARMLEKLTGKPPEQSLAVDEAVAHGAALYASLLLQQRNPQAGSLSFTVTDVNSHSLGMVGVDPATGRRRNQVLIPKNTPLPHAVTKVFKTQKRNQPTIVIRVVEGESERPEACIPVGICTISNLPPDLPAGTPVAVSYAYEANGQLRVTGQVVGHRKGATTVIQRENAMDDEDIRLWQRCLREESATT